MSPPALRVASAPVSFGVDEIMQDDAWMPTPGRHARLDGRHRVRGDGARVAGFMGDARQVNQRLSSRGLEFVGAFLPQHFSRAEKVDEDRAWLRDTLRLMADGSPSGPTGFAVLSDHFDEPDRRAFSGRIEDHPEAWLPDDRFDTLIGNLHEVAEICRGGGVRTRRPPSRRDLHRDGRRDRPGHGPDRPVASSGCASTPATSGSAGPIRPRRSTTTTS